jgi:hypothetical protein
MDVSPGVEVPAIPEAPVDGAPAAEQTAAEALLTQLAASLDEAKANGCHWSWFELLSVYQVAPQNGFIQREKGGRIVLVVINPVGLDTVASAEGVLAAVRDGLLEALRQARPAGAVPVGL